MIAKYFIWLLLLTVAPQWWIDRIYCRHYTPWKRFLCWLPTGIVACYTVYLFICHNGMPANHLLTDLWFLVLGVVVIPQAIYSLCLLAKWGWCRARHRRVTGRNWIGLRVCGSLSLRLLLGIWATASKAYHARVRPTARGVRRLSHCAHQRPPCRDIPRLAFMDAK